MTAPQELIFRKLEGQEKAGAQFPSFPTLRKLRDENANQSSCADGLEASGSRTVPYFKEP